MFLKRSSVVGGNRKWGGGYLCVFLYFLSLNLCKDIKNKINLYFKNNLLFF